MKNQCIQWISFALGRFGFVMIVANVFSIFAAASAEQYRLAHPIHPLFEREFPNEGQLIDEIVQGILQIQQKAKSPDGRLHRGTHAKGVCARAIFEVQNVEDEDLRSGLFATPAQYSALVRFANAASSVGDDRTADVRSMSISVDLGKYVVTPPFVTDRQDFSFNNAPTFPINDIEEFAALFRQFNGPGHYLKGHWTNLEFWESFVSGDFWSEIYSNLKGYSSKIHSKLKGYQQQTRPGQGYQKMQFWSGVPFLAGEDAAVKYVVAPCRNNPSKKLQDDANQLAIEFKRHISEDQEMSCFNISLQKLNADVMINGHKWLLFPNYMEPKDWVENASTLWPSAHGPTHPVARLTFVPQSVLSDAECEAVAFSVGIHSLPAHRGLGSLNRARTMAEWASMQARKMRQ